VELWAARGNRNGNAQKPGPAITGKHGVYERMLIKTFHRVGVVGVGRRAWRQQVAGAVGKPSSEGGVSGVAGVKAQRVQSGRTQVDRGEVHCLYTSVHQP